MTQSTGTDDGADFFTYPTAAPEAIELPAGRTALVVIDLQHYQATGGCGMLEALDRLRPGSTQYISTPVERQVLPAAAQLLATWRERNWPVVHVCYGSEHKDLRDFPARMQSGIKSMGQVRRRGHLLGSEPGVRVPRGSGPR